MALDPEKFGTELAEIVKGAIRPLTKRIETLEAEIKAGHERIKKLEGRHD